MQFPPVRVAPDTRYTAEIVILLTTLGAKRTEYNAGKRARDLLEIKRAHHKIIDFNRDARQAGSGEAENIAIQKLMQQHKLQTGDNDDLILPQIFIDGQYIGDANELQGLEDDGMLDCILCRTACMKCNDQRRQPSAAHCASCWEKFEEILPGMMTIQQALQEIAMLREDYDGDDYDDEEEDEAARAGAGAAPSTATAAAPSAAAAPAPAAFAPAARAAPAAPAVAAPAAPAGAAYQKGDQVQYWSDSKSRWIDALVEGVREKDGKIVYDLNCKKGASADKLKRPGVD